MVEVTLASGGLRADIDGAEVLAVPCHPGPRPAVAALPAAELGPDVLRAAAVTGFAGDPGQTFALPPTRPDRPVVLLYGLAPPTVDPAADAAALRQVTGTVLDACPGAERVLLALPDQSSDRLEDGVRAVAEGAVTAGYRYLAAKPPLAPAGPTGRLEVLVDEQVLERAGDRLRSALSEGHRRGAATNRARDLVNQPANRLTPEALAEAAVESVAGAAVDVEILHRDELVAGGFGGILAVGDGSVSPPCLAVMRYRPADPTGHVVLVGKGVTYDAGGLSLKTQEWLPIMKADMAGAAVVIGVMSALPELGGRTAVTAYLPAAENMPSGSAMRPGDVLTTHAGRTVEVVNADAEGRLLLADALALAVTEPTDAVITVGTLFGGVVHTFGMGFATVTSNRAWLLDEVAAAATAAGERTWPLPLPEDYRSALCSPVADLRNFVGNSGDPVYAGLFLSEFIADRPWLHLDVLGPCWAGPGGATGFGVRSLLTWLQTRSPQTAP